MSSLHFGDTICLLQFCVVCLFELILYVPVNKYSVIVKHMICLAGISS